MTRKDPFGPQRPTMERSIDAARAGGMMSMGSTTPPAAQWLGYGGLIPFFTLAASTLFNIGLPSDLALNLFLAYSAAILAFLGGLRWGAALNQNHDRAPEMIIGALASLWAVAGLALQPKPALAVGMLMLGFILMGALDVARPGPSVPQWMTRLRARLSVLVVGTHAALLVAWLAG